MGKWYLILVIFALTWVGVAQVGPAQVGPPHSGPNLEVIGKAVEGVGVPRELIQVRTSQAFPEVAAIGWQVPGRRLELQGIYCQQSFRSVSEATAACVSSMNPQQALDWVVQVLLAFEVPLLVCPPEFASPGDFREPECRSESPGCFRIRLWVGEPGSPRFSWRDYHLSPRGLRVTVLQRREFS